MRPDHYDQLAPMTCDRDEKFIEQMARNLCDMRKIDPEKLLDLGPQPDGSEQFVVAWIFAADEIRADFAAKSQPALGIAYVPTGFALTENYRNVKKALDMWANRKAPQGSMAEGFPDKCIGATDARIHSIEDLEDENDTVVIGAVHACVWGLPSMERNAILMHYGIMENRVWRADFDRLFDIAVESVFHALKKKIVC
jgi:hypothetical protein